MPNNGQYQAYLQGLHSIAQTIEDLAPNLAGNGPNPEYPWQAGAQIVAPVEHNFTGLEFVTSPPLRKLLDFLEKCFEIV